VTRKVISDKVSAAQLTLTPTSDGAAVILRRRYRQKWMHKGGSTSYFFLSALIAWLLTVSSAFAFDALDVRPVAELELMDESELKGEAVHACTGIIVGRAFIKLGQPQQHRLASQYLRTIGLVVRKKNGGGYSTWYAEILTASIRESTQACFDAAPLTQ
jgi:hypothetical protein